MAKDKYVPKHRSAPAKPVRSRARGVVLFGGVAAAATGLTVSAGVAAGAVVGGSEPDDALITLSAGTASLSQDDLADREQAVSRSGDDRRESATSLKATELTRVKGVAVTRTEDLTVADPKTLARALMPLYGLASSEFDCVDRIWTQESNWNVHADNPRSSAYGIPQALPGSKMSSAGPDWQHSAETQIRWGLGYIKNRYGSACAAWSFKQGHGWY